ncbi:MAG: CNP1-like family protein [Rhodocyclales bacterium]|nr:CNP1-like family protein [Rhodocyclales bacterium]
MSETGWRNAFAGLAVPMLLFVLSSGARAAGPEDYELLRKSIVGDRADNFDEKPWVEIQHQLPPAPDLKHLISIDVGALSDNTFMIDEQSVTFGADEVVRYTLVVTSPGGARNVSYEGMRCATAERRLYAFGRPDGSWAKARNSQWVKISENSLNRHHAALFRDYFCSAGGTVSDTEGARRVLPKGNPAAVVR